MSAADARQLAELDRLILLLGQTVVATAQRRCCETECTATAVAPGARYRRTRCVGCPLNDVDALHDHLAERRVQAAAAEREAELFGEAPR